MGANELSALLWRERQLLELLTFKLDEEQLLLAAGRTQWLPHAIREVEQVMERLREASLARTVEAAAVAAEWGVSEAGTLREIAEVAPESWGEVLRSHLGAMKALTGRIRELRDVNERFLRAAARSTQETLAAVGGDEVVDGALVDTIAADLRTGTVKVGVHWSEQKASAHQLGSLEAFRASIEDLDVGQAILDIRTQEVNYRAALAVSARVLQPTLVDFLA